MSSHVVTYRVDDATTVKLEIEPTEGFHPAGPEEILGRKGHRDEIYAVCAVTVGGRALLASGGDDDTVRLWDPRTSICLLTAQTHHKVLAVAGVADSLAIGGLDIGILVIKPTAVVLASLTRRPRRHAGVRRPGWPWPGREGEPVDDGIGFLQRGQLEPGRSLVERAADPHGS